jgi:hypothetical protein
LLIDLLRRPLFEDFAQPFEARSLSQDSFPSCADDQSNFISLALRERRESATIRPHGEGQVNTSKQDFANRPKLGS